MADLSLDDIKHGKPKIKPDPMATLVKDAFRRSRLYRMTHKLGEETIDTVLVNCYEQYNGVITPDEWEIINRTNVNIKVSMTKNKVDVLEAWVRDLLQQSAESPFVVNASPLPELSDADRIELAQKYFWDSTVNPPLTMNSSEKDIKDYFEDKKVLLQQAQKEEADKKAKNMQDLIHDQLVDGGFRDQYIAFMRNLIQYPYAVLFGPVLEKRPVLKWTGKKLKDTFNVVPVVRNISPFNYFWSPDTKIGGTGQYDIIRERITREYLKQCAGMDSWISENINKILNDYEEYSSRSNDWPYALGFDSDGNPDSDNRFVTVNSVFDDAITILRFFGKVSGRVLKQFGITGVADDEYREIEAVVAGEYTIRLRVREEPIAAGRPIYVTSYTKTNDGVAGFGIAQVLRPIERGFMGALRNTVVNSSFSSMPMGEVDYSRIQEFAGQATITPVPGVMNPVSPTLSGTSENAYKFYDLPNYTGSLWQLAMSWQQLADQYSGLPAALSGQPVGTGVNRTFRGISQLYSNALKGVQSAFTNVDTDILEPLGKNFYIANMLYSDNDDVKGDSQVVSRGMSGLLQVELQKQSTLDLLQALAPIANNVPPGVMEYAIKKATIALGIPENVWDSSEAAAMQQQQIQQQQQQVPQLTSGEQQPQSTTAQEVPLLTNG